MLIDLHVHTLLSSDSNIAPEAYVEAAARAPRRLDAICFTEHRLFPADADLDRRYADLTERFGVMVFKGIEADTNLGHLLLFGVTREVIRRFDLSSRMLKSDSLIEVVHGEGGIAVPAHPFRDSGFGPQLDELCARHGAALSVIEALNGQNSLRENEAAMVATEKLGLVGVGGSDAHFVTPKWFLTCATELERDVRDIEGLCAELRAGRARSFRFEAAPPPASE
ncbi:MAG TPA: PHP-associated domain-containing protein [Candidatus Binataceae bacterium]